MRPVTDQFLESLRGSHKMIADARVLTSFQTGVDPVGTEIELFSGDVTYNATAKVRASLAMTTNGDGMWPADPGGLLTPYGNEVFVRRGIDYGNGTKEWVSQGYYKLYTVEQLRTPRGHVRLVGYDRMQTIIEARLTEPVVFEAGTTVGTIVTTLVTQVYPSAVIEWDDGTTTSLKTIGRTQIVEEDRHGFLVELIASYGKIIYFDHRGILVIKTPPSSTAAVFDIDAGAHGVLIELNRARGREGVYNGVVVNGEGVDTLNPVHAVALDLDPLSPTYWDGPFGKVPKFFTSTFITTQAQALETANSMLAQSVGLPYLINFGSIVNPALEPYDAVTIRTSDMRVTHVIDVLTVPLLHSVMMTGSTRSSIRR